MLFGAQRAKFKAEIPGDPSNLTHTRSILVTLDDHHLNGMTKSKPSRLNLARSNRTPRTTHEGMAVHGAVYREGIASWTLEASRYRPVAYSPIGELREVGIRVGVRGIEQVPWEGEPERPSWTDAIWTPIHARDSGSRAACPSGAAIIPPQSIIPVIRKMFECGEVRFRVIGPIPRIPTVPTERG